MKNGILIAIEGIDGCGKSSAAQALFSYLSQRFPVILTKEPGGTELGKHLRTVLQERTYPLLSKAEFLLFAADRAQHMKEVVMPALLAGKIVISDRMKYSSRAYQGFGRGLDDNWITSINEWVTEGLEADIIIYLKIDYSTARERMHKRQVQATAFEKEQADFFERIAQGFEHIFNGRSNVITIDANKNEEQVHKEMTNEVRVRLQGILQ